MSRLYDRSFAIAFLSQTFFVLANTLMIHYARWVDFLGGNVEQVGWIMGIGSVAGLTLRPWIGQGINRFGARNMWISGYFVFGIASLANLLLDDLNAGIYVIRSGLVLGTAIVFSSSLTYVSQTAPVDRRTEAIGVLGAGGFVGMLVGPLLGDLILGSGQRTEADFRLLFCLATAAMIIPAILLLFLKRPSTKPHNGPVRFSEFMRTVHRYWPGTIVLVVLLFGVCMTVPFAFLASFIDNDKLSVQGFSEIGLFFWAYAGWGITVRLSLRKWPDRIGRRKVLLAGIIFMGIGMFCFPLVGSENAWMLILPGFICGTGHALMFHTMTALTIERFPTEVRGTGSALSLTMLDLGTIAGAPALGKIAQSFGFNWLFITIGSLCLFVGTVYALSSVPVWRARRNAKSNRLAVDHNVDDVSRVPATTEDSCDRDSYVANC